MIILTEAQWNAIPPDGKLVRHRHGPRRCFLGCILRGGGGRVAVEGVDFRILWSDWRHAGLAAWQMGLDAKGPLTTAIISGRYKP